MVEALSLNCEPLDEFRSGMNALLTNLVRSLIERDLETGEVTGKIKVTVKNRTDPDGTPLFQLQIEPDLKMKIGAKGEVKCAKKNGLLMKYDQYGKMIIGSRQVDIDDYIQGTLPAEGGE